MDAAGNVTSQVWDKHNLLAEYDDLGTLEAEYTHEPREYGHLISQVREAEPAYHHYDAQGSTRQLTDDAEIITDDYSYQAFGEAHTRTGTTANPSTR